MARYSQGPTVTLVHFPFAEIIVNFLCITIVLQTLFVIKCTFIDMGFEYAIVLFVLRGQLDLVYIRIKKQQEVCNEDS